ncbi:MAG: hypothetical protein LBE57_06580 [Methanosarcinales archaeon]|jgi:predicted PurR-regulated permease PerM|nr:hypothetical protein [Methanosarcinales archaeon]
MGLSINKKVWQYMLIVAALLFIGLAFVFYIKPVFIALVLGVLVTVLLNTFIETYRRITKNYSSAKRKTAAFAGTVGIVLVVLVLAFTGTMYLLANVNSLLVSFEEFTTHYNETAENMAEEIVNTLEER